MNAKSLPVHQFLFMMSVKLGLATNKFGSVKLMRLLPKSYCFGLSLLWNISFIKLVILLLTIRSRRKFTRFTKLRLLILFASRFNSVMFAVSCRAVELKEVSLLSSRCRRVSDVSASNAPLGISLSLHRFRFKTLSDVKWMKIGGEIFFNGFSSRSNLLRYFKPLKASCFMLLKIPNLILSSVKFVDFLKMLSWSFSTDDISMTSTSKSLTSPTSIVLSSTLMIVSFLTRGCKS